MIVIIIIIIIIIISAELWWSDIKSSLNLFIEWNH